MSGDILSGWILGQLDFFWDKTSGGIFSSCIPDSCKMSGGLIVQGMLDTCQVVKYTIA